MALTLLAALTLMAATAIRNDGTVVRRSCSEDAETVATLDGNTPVEIRFAMAGDYLCYKIAATTGGRQIEGYVPRNTVAGTEDYERARSSAPGLDRAVADTVKAMATRTTIPSGSPAAPEALRLLESHQPAEALRAAEAALRKQPRDAGLLAIAALSAYQADDRRAALEYLERALEAKPGDPMLERLRSELKREVSADRGGERLYGTRFMLRYDGAELDPELARGLLGVLDHEYARVSEQLGCQTGERIPVVVQSPDAFRQATNAQEWTAGRYDGRIRIALVEGRQLGASTRRIAAHEIVHACLASFGQWPSWFHEGLAQKLSGDTLAPAARTAIREAARAGKLPKLSSLDRDWSGMGTAQAVLSYHYALAAADAFFETWQAYGIRNVLADPGSIAKVAASIDRKLAE